MSQLYDNTADRQDRHKMVVEATGADAASAEPPVRSRNGGPAEAWPRVGAGGPGARTPGGSMAPNVPGVHDTPQPGDSRAEWVSRRASERKRAQRERSC